MALTKLHDYTDLINWAIILNLYFFHSANTLSSTKSNSKKANKEQSLLEDNGVCKYERNGYIHLLLDRFFCKMRNQAENLSILIEGQRETFKTLKIGDATLQEIEELEERIDNVVEFRERYSTFLSDSSLIPLLYSFITLIIAHLELKENIFIVITQSLFIVTLFCYILFWILMLKSSIERQLKKPMVLILTFLLAITFTAFLLSQLSLPLLFSHWNLLVCLLPFINIVLFFISLPIDLRRSINKVKKLSSLYEKHKSFITGTANQQGSRMIKNLQNPNTNNDDGNMRQGGNQQDGKSS